MARIIGAERVTGVHSNDTGGSTSSASGGGDAVGMRTGSGNVRNVGGRKPSFKTRGPGGGLHGQYNRNIRATKVTLPASKVRELASKFNAVVVNKESEGRALLNSTRVSKTQTVSRISSEPSAQQSSIDRKSIVLATIQRFEGINDVKGSSVRSAERPKCVLVRTNSSSKESPIERSRDIPRTVPEEKIASGETKAVERVPIKDEPEVILRLEASPENVHSRSNGRSSDRTPIIQSQRTSLYSGARKPIFNQNKPEIKPKPPDPTRKHAASMTNLYKSSYKESFSINNNNRLSLPKVTILDDLLDDNVDSKKPNRSFLWGKNSNTTNESQNLDGNKLPKHTPEPTYTDVEDESVSQPKSESESSNDEKIFKIPARPRSLINLKTNIENEANSEKSDEVITPSSLIANKSSLYRDMGRSQESVSSLKRSQENIGIGRSRESVASENRSSQDAPSVLNRYSTGSQSSLCSRETIKCPADLPKEPIRVSFGPLLEDRHVIQKNEAGETKKSLNRVPSIRSNASYEDIGNYKYEDMVENSYTLIGEYDDSEAIYDDVLNVVPPAAIEGIYESIYNGVNPKDDSDSSLELQNSLYDLRPVSQTSSGSGGHQSPASKSDTSDEWVDIELEDREQKEEFILLEETAKPKIQHGSWSQRVRRQWSHRLAEEFKISRVAISSPSKVYLLSSDSDVKRPTAHELEVPTPTKGLVSLRDIYFGGKYEDQEITIHLRSEGEPSEEVYEPNIYDESSFLDDFDDSSDSESEGGSKVKSGGFNLNQPVNPSMPSQQRESEGIYGLMMSAGKKVKKTSWSISQRLRQRMSKISTAVTNGSESGDQVGESGSQKRWPSFKKKSRSGTSKFYLDSAPNLPVEPISLQSPPPDSVPVSNPMSLPLVLPAPTSKQPPRRPSPPLTATDPRRLSTAFSTAPRPTSPPPPPPLVNGESKATSKVNDHTLYVESGLFDHAHPPPMQQFASNQTNQSSNETNGFLTSKTHSSSQWYSDAGLYENTTPDPILSKTRRSIDEPLPDLPIRRVSNSSWYSDLGLTNRKPPSDADSGHGSQLDLQFADEPLYQFYAARVAELEQRENNSDIGYEEIGPNSDLSDREIYSPSDVSVGSVGSGGVRPSAMDLVSPESIHRTLWCQVPQVINSGILESLTVNQKRLQEAKFELITSEASYYKSLSVLEKVFANSLAFKDETIIPKVDYKTVFGNIVPVRKCSEAMLAGMEKCWQDSILLDGICDVLLSVTKEKFSAYVRYCSHQVAIERTLKRLKKNPVFAEKLANLESSPACHSLSLSSFLLLPMQRVTRLPLLLDAIMTKLESGSSESESCQAALLAVNKVVHDCNEAARQTERLEEMGALSRALTFPKHLRPLPLMSASRWLIRSGQVVQYNSETKLTFSKKLTAPRQTKLTLFLFNDLFFVTKKKGDDNFSVITYCPRNFVQMSPEEDPLVAPGSMPSRFLLSITILENHEGKTQELMVYCSSESCRQRWLQPFSRPTSEDPDQVLYETWDCPQVVASHTYSSAQPDELSLQTGDVVNVLTKMADGWFYGERLRDSEKGWFPGNYVTEVASAHVRARNLRQRHRLLALSSSLIQQRQQQLG